ncbi:MAG: polysaccharide deacetylase family protein [Bacillota bacterium]
MSDWMTWLLLTLFGYVGLPTLLARLGFARTLKRAQPRRRLVALTFDDGPDPVWTPRILQILDRHGVKACFFILGDHAAAHPELVRQIHAAGHEIGVHGYRHRLPALLGLRATLRDVGETVRLLTEITGQRPRFYRPPWGIFNLWTAMAARRHGLVPVVWSLYLSEWSHSTTPARICAEALTNAHPGCVLLLHDAAGPGSREDAPQLVARALPPLIAGLRRKGYALVSLSELLTPLEGGGSHATPDPPVGSHRP